MSRSKFFPKEMVKPCRMLSSSDNSSEFFKVYLPTNSSKQLSIPPVFSRRFNGTIPNKAVLEDHAGTLWDVRLEEVEGIVFIRNGWEAFASEHSLEPGDFLVFKYDGEYLFDVKIFGKHGCRKEGALATNKIIAGVGKEKETEEEQMHSKPTHACKRKNSEIGLKTTKKSDSSVERQYKSRMIDIKNVEEPKASVAYTKPRNPYFVSYITRSRTARYVLYIPKKVLNLYGIELKPDMILHDQNGKKWPMEVRFKKGGRIFITTGWHDFQKKNKLGTNDMCIFEFLFTSGNISNEMQVQVVRAGSATQKHSR